jgi:hypothetical protein
MLRTSASCAVTGLSKATPSIDIIMSVCTTPPPPEMSSSLRKFYDIAEIQCTSCGVSFMNRLQYQRHFETVHSLSPRKIRPPEYATPKTISTKDIDMIPDTELGLTGEEIALLRHHQKRAAKLLVKIQQKRRWFRRDNSISDENVFDDESEEDAVFEAEPDADKAAEKRSRPRTRDGPRGEGFRDRKSSPAAWGEGKKAYSAEQENRELREQEREMERLEDERERQRAEAEAKTQGGEYSNNSDIGQNDSAQKNAFLGALSRGPVGFGQMSRAFKQMGSQPWKSSKTQTSIHYTISRDNTGGESARRAELFAEFGRRRGFCDLITNLAEESPSPEL